MWWGRVENCIYHPPLATTNILSCSRTGQHLLCIPRLHEWSFPGVPPLLSFWCIPGTRQNIASMFLRSCKGSVNTAVSEGEEVHLPPVKHSVPHAPDQPLRSSDGQEENGIHPILVHSHHCQRAHWLIIFLHKQHTHICYQWTHGLFL